ncbi:MULTISPECIES: ATP synthase subunit C [Anaerococcus]|uniref:ATP synthase subunit C n=3 Tax=Anaerococcus TaxID=165779 RepID=C7HUA8_9FIRM|nr:MULTISPECIES: ATP synthase subunit C [Anaerococcus]EEU12676.1 ATP synthase subunit C [Anaerococcus vaginalis ATCC 51170]MBS4888589.1 ATPase [Anaerococcus vaginalis]MBS6920452.1 ATPase [Anaerococcus vaginalis]MDD7766107.1 ATP synthase subunit C [Anaerococcus vaginalis]MDU0946630.1 ATP synthase subunit C [Anaerococcus vaginalis]
MILISILALACVVITIYSGLYLLKNNEDSSKEKIRKALKINLSTFIPIMVMILVLVLPNGVKAATAGSASETASGLKYIGAALSTGLATIGTGYAVGQVGSAALGAISEDASILGRTIIFVGLAEGIAIFGVIISIMILFA